MAQTSSSVPLTERALAARLSRKLAQQDEALRRCSRSSRWHGELGDYYVINVNMNAVTAKDIDLIEWAREFGCIKPWEKLVEEAR